MGVFKTYYVTPYDALIKLFMTRYLANSRLVWPHDAVGLANDAVGFKLCGARLKR